MRQHLYTSVSICPAELDVWLEKMFPEFLAEADAGRAEDIS